MKVSLYLKRIIVHIGNRASMLHPPQSYFNGTADTNWILFFFLSAKI